MADLFDSISMRHLWMVSKKCNDGQHMKSQGESLLQDTEMSNSKSHQISTCCCLFQGAIALPEFDQDCTVAFQLFSTLNQ